MSWRRCTGALLSGRRVLVVLDNAASAAQVRPLLPGMAGSHAIVTSRNRLSGLSSRDGAQRLTLGLLPPCDAVTLIGRIAGNQRTRADPAAADRLAQLCGRLPLALRITADRAASLRHLSMTDLVDELTLEHERLDALAADEKTTQVRTVFSWSYQSLDPASARAFRLLSLHPGPRYQHTCSCATPRRAGPGNTAAAQGLRRRAPARRDSPGPVSVPWTWFASTPSNVPIPVSRNRPGRLPFTVCSPGICIAPMRSSVPWAPAGRTFTSNRRRHRVDLQFSRPPVRAWPGLAEGETASLIPVIRQATAVNDDVIAWKLPATLGTILSYQQKYADLLPALISALAATQRLGDRAAEAQILTDLASAYLYLGRPVQATESCQHALAISTETGNPHGQWAARQLEGVAHLALEQFSEARDCLQQALATARQTPDPLAEGMTLIWLGAVLENLGTPEAAINLPERAQRPSSERRVIGGSMHSPSSESLKPAIARVASTRRSVTTERPRLCSTNSETG